MASQRLDSFKTRTTLRVGNASFDIFELGRLGRDLSRLPYSIRILLENVLRNEDGMQVNREDVEAVLAWSPDKKSRDEIAFKPARVILQDFTGVPAVVDLAAMRDAMVALGGQAGSINPNQPVDLVIDHSVQVDRYGTPDALAHNTRIEFERNKERYQILRWAQDAFTGFRAVPPGTGIVHQVNLEYLASVVCTSRDGDANLAYPDTLVGTDSHTTMINGLGVVGWGVGGIEAEAAMLSQPISMLVPEVVGMRLVGTLPSGATATDLVLTVTQMLRAHGVVGKFVEFCGPGLNQLSLADRATLANMAPEYGATMGFFPVDAETIAYLRLTGRDTAAVDLVEAYCRKQGLFRSGDAPEPTYSSLIELDISTIVPSIAGPRRPQDRIPLAESKPAWRKALSGLARNQAQGVSREDLDAWISGARGANCAPGTLARSVSVEDGENRFALRNGAVVIAAITSCTNTSNPSVLMAAGILARRAVARGLKVKPWVKTSLAPGSQVVTDYLKAAGLQTHLDHLGFNLVGYGCTTCIGNSGPLNEAIAKAITDNDLVAVSVLSGNRNFEGRINPYVRANYLASPPLVVAYALAGTMDIDFDTEPIGLDGNGRPVYLRDIWPSGDEVSWTMSQVLSSDMFRARYSDVFKGDENWRNLEVPSGERFAWDETSTYIKCPPFFDDMEIEPKPFPAIRGARVLALLGDSVTTDHISPAGSIAKDSPAAAYLRDLGVDPRAFNSYGARRGNHEVMMRGTFANIRLRNQLAPGTEGGWTRFLPDGGIMTIYDASVRYREAGTPLIVLAGAEYGTGSSRDWAAKGTMLLGVRAVIAKSFERIHRSNLIGMGVLPCQFLEGEDAQSLGLSGKESFDISGIENGLKPGMTLDVVATSDEGTQTRFQVLCRIDTPQEAEYVRHGGILQFALRRLLASPSGTAA